MGKISQAFSKIVGFVMDIVFTIVQQSENQNFNVQNHPREPQKKKQITKKQLRKYTKTKLLKARPNKRQLSSQTSSIIDPNPKNQPQSSSQQTSIANKIPEADRKSSNINFLSYIKQKQQEILCSICRQSILLPAITQCNHVFCLQCIQQSINISKVCPLCRNALNNGESYGIFIFRALEDIIEKIRKEDDNLVGRLKEHNEWKQKRFVPLQSFQQGLKIDVWKIDSKQWKKGAVVLVYRDSNDAIESILVHYQNCKNDTDEVIEISSLRITSYEFYTQKQERGFGILNRVFSRNSFMIDNFSQNIFPLRNFLQTRIQNERSQLSWILNERSPAQSIRSNRNRFSSQVLNEHTGQFSSMLQRRTTFNSSRFDYLRNPQIFSTRPEPQPQLIHLDNDQDSQLQINDLISDQQEMNLIVNLDSYRDEEPQSPTQVTGQVEEAENRGNQEELSLLNHLDPNQLMFENQSDPIEYRFPEENDEFIGDNDF